MDLLARENLLLYSLYLDVKIWPQVRQVTGTGTLKKWVQFWADLRDIGRCFHEQEPPKPFRAILDDFNQLETIPINCTRSYMILGLSS